MSEKKIDLFNVSFESLFNHFKFAIRLALYSMIFIGFLNQARATHQLPTYQQLCSYDKYCTKIGKYKNNQLEVKPISSELMQYYGRLRNTVIKIARLYKIDSTTLIAPLIAENTMNVNITDMIQDFLTLNKLTPEAELLGRPMTVGPGQIYTSTALKVEGLAARIEGRKKRSRREITSILSTSLGSLMYAAAILREAQDVYEKNGIDISQRPEILGTLYNIGEPEKRVENTLKTQRAPLPNYFGYFIALQYRYIQTELQLPPLKSNN